MIRLTFSEENAIDLQQLRFNHPHPRVQRKIEVLLLKANDLPHNQIATIAGICENTVVSYLEEYKQGGIAQLTTTRFYKPQSVLASFHDQIKEHFQIHPPATIKEAVNEIEKITGIKRSASQIRKYLESIGMKRRKTGSIPAKADIEKQEIFKNEQLEPKLNEARNGERVVYFVDAVHFVFAPFLGFLWCFTRLFVKAPSGRLRFNVLGALNAVTHELLTITNTTYINAQSVCDLLLQIAEQNITAPITLILDNAKYQKCAVVQKLAASLKIELLYLPTYSPNLNLIERMWKFTKKHCLNTKYYPDFKSFSNTISTFLKYSPIQFKNELDSLLVHKFQNFKKLEMHFIQERYTDPISNASSTVPNQSPD